MKPIHTHFRFLPATALLALGVASLPLQGSPGHSSVSADFRSSAVSERPAASKAFIDPDAVVSDLTYGFDSGGAFFQPVGDLDSWINRASRYYNRYRNQQSNRRYDRNDRNSRSYRGYYPNDPDDRNNPRHPDYIGPPGSYRSYRHYSRPSQGYYPNDPDDRNNPNHPDYIGRGRWGR